MVEAANSDADMARVNLSSGYLGEHRGKEEIIILVDQRDLRVGGLWQQVGQFLRRIDARKACSHNHDPWASRYAHALAPVVIQSSSLACAHCWSLVRWIVDYAARDVPEDSRLRGRERGWGLSCHDSVSAGYGSCNQRHACNP